MVDIGLRIREIREVKNLTQIEFCEKVGIKQSNLSHIENKGAKISIDIIRKIISYFNINSEWLLIGNGSMEKQEIPKNEADHIYVCMLEKKEAEISRLNREIGALQERLEAFRKMGKDQSVVPGVEYDELVESKILNNR